METHRSDLEANSAQSMGSSLRAFTPHENPNELLVVVTSKNAG